MAVMDQNKPEDADEFWEWLNHWGNLDVYAETDSEKQKAWIAGYKSAITDTFNLYDDIHRPSREAISRSNNGGKFTK